MITLLEVNSSSREHAYILYELLKHRKYTISNKNIVSFKEHIHFVKNHPYRKWYIIYRSNKEVGTCYCTYENSIGINLIFDEIDLYKEIILKISNSISALASIPSVRNKNFVINVPTENKVLQNALKDLDAVPIQITFLLS